MKDASQHTQRSHISLCLHLPNQLNPKLAAMVFLSRFVVSSIATTLFLLSATPVSVGAESRITANQLADSESTLAEEIAQKVNSAEAAAKTNKAASKDTTTASNTSKRRKAPLVSALYRQATSAKNPYGDLHSKKGLWPYKPGQKYERTNERGGGLFNGLFGG